MDNLKYDLLSKIADIDEMPTSGAYSLRKDGEGVMLGSSENVTITKKADKPGIDIVVKPNTKNETIYIPVIITDGGVKDLVYNDFIIGENSDITIVAGCGIHNDCNEDSQHDGIHAFDIGENAKVKYTEKHYGEGAGKGERILNPTTIVNMQPNSACEMELTQVKGVNSTVRTTTAHLQAGAKMLMVEKLMTHGSQVAKSDMDVFLDGEGASLQIISRSVAKDGSIQVFHPKAIGNASCRAHVQCDSIIMDNAKISSIPEIVANHADAQIVHEAAIGRINNDQLLKLQTLGLSEEEAENIIVKGFLK